MKELSSGLYIDLKHLKIEYRFHAFNIHLRYLCTSLLHTFKFQAAIHWHYTVDSDYLPT